uniref:Ubiquitin-like protease family profile domain-containing protein n=2 Tax=Rhodosorus marinus TaxID=101924 RepID=A0A7S2ZHN5_9RHOD|mmetsp:Transcript_19871/g.79270  ORF Transcript_19871/g.79270 Transcript_19871/m.79270 type:complete len:647 (+) Transcript_19871:148-2088(+)
MRPRFSGRVSVSMASILGPLKQAIGSASQFLSPRKRTREAAVNCSDAEDWDRSNHAGERGPKRVAVEGQEQVESGKPVKDGQNKIDGSQAPKSFVQHGHFRADERVSTFSNYVRSVDGPLSVQKPAKQFANVLDQYAYLKTVQKYEDVVSTFGRAVKAGSAEKVRRPGNLNGDSTPRRRGDGLKDATTRRLSYGTPAISRTFTAGQGVGVNASSNERTASQRFREQKVLEEENRELQRRIENIERVIVPLHSSMTSSRRMLMGDLLGDGVNDEVVQRKLDRLQDPIPSLSEYRRRQALRQARIMASERTLALLQAEIGSRVTLPFQSEPGKLDTSSQLEVTSNKEQDVEEIDIIDLDEEDDLLTDDLHDEDKDDLEEEGLAEDSVEEPDDEDLVAGVSVVDEADPKSDLTEDAKRRVRRALSGSLPRQDVLVDLNNLTLTGEDMLRLRPNQWLNDEIINCYTTLLQERNARALEDENCPWPNSHFMSTFFYTRLVSTKDGEADYDYRSVRRWTRKVDIFSKDVLVIPINHENFHWACAVIDLRRRQLSYFDSLGGKNTTVLGHLLQWLRDESMDKKKVALDVEGEGWEQVFPGSSVPQQTNGDDCGIFACKFADYYAQGKAFDFGTEDMGYFRMRIVAELLAKRAC